MKEVFGNVWKIGAMTSAGLFRAKWVFAGAALLSFGIGLLTLLGEQERRWIQFFGVSLMITLALFLILFAYYVAAEVRGDVDSKKIQPVLGLPITRDEYLVGKWLGVVVPAMVLLTACLLGVIAAALRESPTDWEDALHGVTLLFLVGVPLVLAFFSGVFFLGLYLHPMLNLLVHGATYGILVPVFIYLQPGNDWYPMRWIALLFPHAPFFPSNEFGMAMGSATAPFPWDFITRLVVHDLAWVFGALFLALVAFRTMNVTRAN